MIDLAVEKSVKLCPMNDLSHPLPASAITTQRGIIHRSRDKAAEILPDEQIDPFDLYESVATCPVALSVPHGGWQYPQSLVTANNFKRCISLADTGTSELGAMLAESHFPVLIASCGRAACDLNRSLDALDGLLCSEVNTPVPVAFKPYVAAGYGVIPRLSADKQPLYERILDKAKWQSILEKWHKPYHHKLANLLDRARMHYKNVVLIDLHSMPDNPDRSSRTRFFSSASQHLPDFVFGNLHGATLRQNNVERIDTVMGQSGYSWQWNTPYAGGFITRHYGLHSKEDNTRPPVEVLQLEVNRRLYTAVNATLDYDRMRPIKRVIKQIVDTLSDN